MNNRQDAEMQIMKMIIGGWISELIYVVSELGIADILSNGEHHIEEIAQKTETTSTYLYRLMRELSSVGVFIEKEEKVFQLSPLGGCLKSDRLRYISMMFGSEWHNRLWDKLPDLIKYRKNASINALGEPIIEWLSKNPTESSILNNANAVKIKDWYQVIKKYYDFSKIGSLIDMGGGIGSLITEILLDNPEIRGAVADLGHVTNEAEINIIKAGLINRCDIIECNFFKNIPDGYDGYILSNVLHDWDDERCSLILDNCYQSMKKTSRLIILEMLIPERNEPSVVPIMDIEVLLMSNGKERTRKEFNELLNPLGFDKINFISTKSNIYVIECIK
jgi:hypothetical protein